MSVMRDGTVCGCLDCQVEEEIPIDWEEIPPTLRSADSEEVLEEYRRQSMLDDIMAQARGEKQ